MRRPGYRTFRHSVLLFLASASVAAGGCAQRAAQEAEVTQSAARATYQPPELQTAHRPNLRGYWSQVARREIKPTGLTVRVWVDELGRPDLSRLVVSGMGASENHQTIREWLQGVAFRPAVRDGRAVAGEFRMVLRPEPGP